mgnify:CR=1 FL=1
MNELEFFRERYEKELTVPDLNYSYCVDTPVYGNFCGLQRWVGRELWEISKKLNAIDKVKINAEYSRRYSWYLYALTKRTLRIFNVKDIDDDKKARLYYEKWYKKTITGFKVYEKHNDNILDNLDIASSYIKKAAEEVKDADFIRETFLALQAIEKKIKDYRKNGTY